MLKRNYNDTHTHTISDKQIYILVVEVIELIPCDVLRLTMFLQDVNLDKGARKILNPEFSFKWSKTADPVINNHHLQGVNCRVFAFACS